VLIRAGSIVIKKIASFKKWNSDEGMSNCLRVILRYAAV
jgi:hypothetical protein